MVSRGKVNEPFSTKPFSSEHLDEINSTGSSADRLSAASSSPRLLRYFFSLSLPLTEETLFPSDQSRIVVVQNCHTKDLYYFPPPPPLNDRSKRTKCARETKKLIRKTGEMEGVEKLIKFISIHGEKEREIKRTVFGSVGRSKTIERGKTRGGERGADNGSARSDKKRRAALK